MPEVGAISPFVADFHRVFFIEVCVTSHKVSGSIAVPHFRNMSARVFVNLTLVGELRLFESVGPSALDSGFRSLIELPGPLPVRETLSRSPRGHSFPFSLFELQLQFRV